MARMGILGGTFDPPHIAHLVIADQARSQLDLARVLFAPAGQPPHKLARVAASSVHRVAMTRLAIAGCEGFILSLVDVNRPGPHYTVDALALVQAQYPGDELYLLIGADSLRDLPKWHAPERVMAQARLVVMRRPNVAPDWNDLETALPGSSTRVEQIDAPWLDISSHDLRRRVCRGLSIRHLVPKSVEEYIVKHGLYRA